MSECVCPRIDGYRIRKRDCPVHNECLDSVGPIPKLDGDTYVCVKPKGHDMPHESPNGAWWEPPSLPAQPRRPKETEMASERADEETGPGWFWTRTEWADWSNELALLIPEDDVSTYSNPDGAQESIITDCLRAYVTERADMEAQRDAASMRSGEWARRNWNASAGMKARIRALGDEVRTWPRYGPCGFLDEIPANSVEAFIRALLDAAPAGGAE